MSCADENDIMFGLHQLNRNFRHEACYMYELSAAMPVASHRIYDVVQFEHEQRGGFAYRIRVAGEG